MFMLAHAFQTLVKPANIFLSSVLKVSKATRLSSLFSPYVSEILFMSRTGTSSLSFLKGKRSGRNEKASIIEEVVFLLAPLAFLTSLLAILYFFLPPSEERIVGIFVSFSMLVLGSCLVYRFGDILVETCKRIASSLGVSHFFFGVFFLPLVTTLPNVFLSFFLLLSGTKDMIVMNSVGNNVFNLTFIIPLAVFIGRKYVVKNETLLKNSMFILIFSSFLLYFFFLDLTLTRMEALFLLLTLAVFLRGAKGIRMKEAKGTRKKNVRNDVILAIISAVLIFLGCFFIERSVKTLMNMGYIQRNFAGFVLLTIAVTLPEGFVALWASKKGLIELSLGNIVGDNLGSIPLTLGIFSLASPISVSHTISSVFLPFYLFTIVVFSLLLFFDPLRIKKGKRYDIKVEEALLLFFIFIAFLWISHKY